MSLMHFARMLVALSDGFSWHPATTHEMQRGIEAWDMRPILLLSIWSARSICSEPVCASVACRSANLAASSVGYASVSRDSDVRLSVRPAQLGLDSIAEVEVGVRDRVKLTEPRFALVHETGSCITRSFAFAFPVCAVDGRAGCCALYGELAVPEHCVEASVIERGDGEECSGRSVGVVES